MKQAVFTGSCTAMITPFDESGIDFQRLGRQLEFQEKNGTAAVLIAGTTGENATLEIHEFEKLVDLSVSAVKGRMKVIAGIGGNDTASCLKKAQTAKNLGADAVLMSAPYYNKTSPAGLIDHFIHVADRTDIPLIIYNIPSRTGMNIGIGAYRELAKHPNINGVKEASGDLTLAGRTIAECGDDLNIWSGNDADTLPMMALGAKGVISVASNIMPQTLSMLCALCRSGDHKAARELYFRHSELFSALFTETNPIPIKAAMEELGLDSGRLRLPLLKISDENRQKLKSAMAKSGLIECE